MSSVTYKCGKLRKRYVVIYRNHYCKHAFEMFNLQGLFLKSVDLLGPHCGENGTPKEELSLVFHDMQKKNITQQLPQGSRTIVHP